jgi:hypothetical protein
MTPPLAPLDREAVAEAIDPDKGHAGAAFAAADRVLALLPAAPPPAPEDVTRRIRELEEALIEARELITKQAEAINQQHVYRDELLAERERDEARFRSEMDAVEIHTKTERIAELERERDAAEARMEYYRGRDDEGAVIQRELEARLAQVERERDDALRKHATLEAKHNTEPAVLANAWVAAEERVAERIAELERERNEGWALANQYRIDLHGAAESLRKQNVQIAALEEAARLAEQMDYGSPKTIAAAIRALIQGDGK